MGKGQNKQQSWYRLDNTAIMYAAIRRTNFATIFRFSALMDEKVDPARLQEAVNRTLKRFPLFDVKLKKGLFWQYLDHKGALPPVVQPDTADACAPLRSHRDRSDVLRIFYYENRISIEMFHVLADGTGGSAFFVTLLAVYLRLSGIAIPNGSGVYDVDAEPDPEESEDAYLRFATSGTTRGMKDVLAYKFRGTPEAFFTLNVIRGMLPVDRVKEVAKSYGGTITEYLSAVLLQVFIDLQEKEGRHKKKPVALAVPVNLRSFFPTKSLRNFILSLRPSIDPALGEYTFEEIMAQVRHYMRLYTSRQFLQAQTTANVKKSTNPVLQLFPLFIKDFGVDLAFRRIGDRQYTTTFTNPGILAVPDAMRSHVLQAEAMIGPAYTDRPCCAALSYGNILTINFASTVRETDVERRFFTRLVQDGIPVKIESNRR